MICTCITHSDSNGTTHFTDCNLISVPKPMEAGHKDEGKVQFQYILAMPFFDEVAKVGTFGAAKYGQWNYKAGMPWMKLCGSMSRHLIAFIRGENNDTESGLSHLAHLAYDAAMVYSYIGRHDSLDDRWRDR